MTHPGEKRMQQICAAECRLLPGDFNKNLDRLFDTMFRTDPMPVIRDMVTQLRDLAAAQGFV